MTCLAVCAAMRPKSCGSDVALLDLVAVLLEQLRVELGLLGLAQLARLGVDGGLRGVDRGQQLLLELLGDEQLVDDEVAGVAVHVDARVAGGPGLLLVGREEGVLQGGHQAIGGDPLLALEDLHGFDDLFGHDQPSRRLLRLMSL